MSSFKMSHDPLIKKGGGVIAVSRLDQKIPNDLLVSFVVLLGQQGQRAILGGIFLFQDSRL